MGGGATIRFHGVESHARNCALPAVIRGPLRSQASTIIDSGYDTRTVKSNRDGGIDAACALDPNEGHGCRHNGESSNDSSVTQLWWMNKSEHVQSCLI